MTIIFYKEDLTDDIKNLKMTIEIEGGFANNEL